MDIIWAQPTELSTNLTLWETGWREHPLPRPDSLEQDIEFKQIKNSFFQDGPKLKFISSPTFISSMPGYVFYLGPSGLGYYIDPLIIREVMYQ